MSISTTNAIDLFIGLAFFFFILSLVASAVNEGVAQILNLRAKTLEKGIRNLLEDPAETESGLLRLWNRIRRKTDAAVAAPATATFYAHPRIAALKKPKRLLARDRKPSYIPSRAFVLTVLDLFGADAAKPTAGAAAPGPATGAAPGPALQRMLADAVADAKGDADRLRASLEESFNEVMDRVSGWYKRRVQVILFAIALVLVVLINADAYVVAQRLWKSDAVRSAVVAQASRTQSQSQACSKKASPAERAAECVDSLKELGMPLGWSRATSPSGWAIPAKIGGLLVTVFAIMLGAPFWFDLLGKVAQLRGSGPSPKDTKSVTAAQS